MDDSTEPTTASATPAGGDEAAGGFLGNILTPGSSLNPTFLLVVDVVLGALLLIFFGLLVLTRGSLHFVFLMLVTGCLWASVKWFVAELRNVQSQEKAQGDSAQEKIGTKLKDE